MFMTQADATIVNVAGPSIHSGLGGSGAELELVIGGYFVAYAMLLITGARLGEMRGYLAPSFRAWGCSPSRRSHAGSPLLRRF